VVALAALAAAQLPRRMRDFGRCVAWLPTCLHHTGCLAAWLPGCLLACLPPCLSAYLVGWLAGWLPACLPVGLAGWGRPAGQVAGLLFVGWLVGCLAGNPGWLSKIWCTTFRLFK